MIKTIFPDFSHWESESPKSTVILKLFKTSLELYKSIGSQQSLWRLAQKLQEVKP